MTQHARCIAVRSDGTQCPHPVQENAVYCDFHIILNSLPNEERLVIVDFLEDNWKPIIAYLAGAFGEAIIGDVWEEIKRLGKRETSTATTKETIETSTSKWQIIKRYTIEPEADLREADLREADLREADLREADLHEADLYNANLDRVNLQGANLQGANLGHANLRWADLRNANLEGVNLQDANLRNANLEGVNLQDANLTITDLFRVNLQGANLGRAILQQAFLREAKLQDANLPNNDRWQPGYDLSRFGVKHY